MGNPPTAERFFSSWYAYWLGGALVAASLAVRIISYPVVTSDYTYFLAKWFDALAHAPGLTAFGNPFSDYAPLYLYFLKFLTIFPVSSLYSIKTLSLLFDALIAYLACLILSRVSKQPYTRGGLLLTFAIVFSIPTVLINSSLWGQSDALYAAGVIASLYFIVRDKPLWATVSFALGICLKLQAIFFLPVLAGYLLRKKETVWQLLLIPFFFALSIVPAWMGGGSFGHWLTIYVFESKEYPSLNVSAQSIFAFTDGLALSPGLQHVLFWIGIVLAGAAALAIAGYVARAPGRSLTARRMLYLSLVCVLALPYFLPRMHERYFYLADVISVIYALYLPRQWFVPVLVVLASFISYMPFLHGQVAVFHSLDIGLQIPSALLACVLGFLVYKFVYFAHVQK